MRSVLFYKVLVNREHYTYTHTFNSCPITYSFWDSTPSRHSAPFSIRRLSLHCRNLFLSWTVWVFSKHPCTKLDPSCHEFATELCIGQWGGHTHHQFHCLTFSRPCAPPEHGLSAPPLILSYPLVQPNLARRRCSTSTCWMLTIFCGLPYLSEVDWGSELSAKPQKELHPKVQVTWVLFYIFNHWDNVLISFTPTKPQYPWLWFWNNI